jgi:formylglycine-generating enzyme required for sulfatase activity
LRTLFKIRDHKGERTVAEDRFPIVIGAGPTADIRIPDLKKDEETAYIGLSNKQPFVQAGQSETAVLYNGQALTGSAWLLHADTLQIGSCKIAFQAEGNDFIIQVAAQESKIETVKPSPDGGVDQTPKIKPISFRSDRRQPRTGSFIRNRRFIGLAVAFSFLLLFMAAWFVFTAKQITILIEPEPDQISIGGSLIAPRLGGHFLLRPGQYKLKAVKECYYPFEGPFEVGEAKRQDVRFRMQRLPGRLSLKAHQSGKPQIRLDDARIIIDGQEVASTPVQNLEVKAGRRVVEIQADNYQDLKTEMQIEGCSAEQSFDFALVPGWSDVFISSIPEGATVSVDGKPAGNTPLKIELPEGNYLVQIDADGFKTWQTRLAVKLAQRQDLTEIRLQPADGTLVLQTAPSGANVTVGQKFVGKTPLNIPVSANTLHEIRISKAGYEKVTRRVKVSTGKSKKLTVDLKPLLGVIHFKVTPADAQLIVNGKNRGLVPSKLQLVAVSHLLEIKKKGYKPFQTRITPRPGYPQEIKINLSRLQSKTKVQAGVITAKNGYPLKLIRPQSFTMGSSRREQGRRSNETLRKINLQRPFYMGAREVTNKEFKDFQARHNSGTFKGQRLSQGHHAVVQVTWDEAAMFCNWLSARESLPPAYVNKGGRMVAVEPIGTGYRLPTEAEWEYCARFAKNQAALKYPWGNRFPPTTPSGNYADISAKNILPAHIQGYNDGYPGTAPPGKFKANALGLYDLGGNVAEWCHDFYTIYTYNINKSDIDPYGPSEGKHHVVKGSSWKYASMSKLRLAYRDYSDGKRPDLGFRVCRYAN